MPNFTQGCIAMNIYWKRTWYEVSKKVRHTPYLLKTAEKNIFQSIVFSFSIVNFSLRAKIEGTERECETLKKPKFLSSLVISKHCSGKLAAMRSTF